MKKIAVLGYFDSIHKGHLAVLESAKMLCRSKRDKIIVFSFNDGFFNALNHKILQINTFLERYELLNSIGNFELYPLNKDILQLTADDFLKSLLKLKITDIVVGQDFKFGKDKSGDVSFLKKNKASFNINVVPLILNNDRKISTTDIRKMIQEGDISGANTCLIKPYFIIGKVVKGRQIGRTLGFPTANIVPPQYKLLPSDGVYATRTVIRNIEYLSITNVGIHPTFEDTVHNVETYIFGFNGDLYDKTICVIFDYKIREIVKFSSVEMIIKQLNNDLKVRLKND